MVPRPRFDVISAADLKQGQQSIGNRPHHGDDANPHHCNTPIAIPVVKPKSQKTKSDHAYDKDHSVLGRHILGIPHFDEKRLSESSSVSRNIIILQFFLPGFL